MRRADPIRSSVAVAAGLAGALLLAVMPAAAVEPGERLADPALESRARGLSAELRCLVCQNQSIDDSNAPLAKDLRVLVREQISRGRSDREVLEHVVARYGEFVLLRPRWTAATALLWLAPLLMLGATAAVLYTRARARPVDAVAPLTEAERLRLDRLLGRDGKGRDGQGRDGA